MNIESIGVSIALAVTVLIAFWAVFKTYRGSNDANEYFTAYGLLDRKRIFFSVFATTFSAFTVVGLPAMFFAHGVGTFWFMWVGIALTPITIRVIGKRIVKLSIDSNKKYTSPIGLLTAGYNSQTLTLILSVLTIIVLFPYLTLQIAGIGKFLVSVSNGSIDYVFGTVFCCVLVGLYVFTGGAKADAETDLVQGVILILGTITLGVSIFLVVGDNISESISVLSESKLLETPGPKGYFTIPVLISYFVIFTLISVSTPQVSQKLMGISKMEDLGPLSSLWFYPVVGSIVVTLAGVVGLYAASNLEVASPDFVAGDVIRDISSKTSGIGQVVFFLVATLFISAVLSAAVSTIDSLLLAVSGIVSDNVKSNSGALTVASKPKLKLLTVALLIAGLIFSAQPPLFIVSLAQIQLSGLTSLLPCLLGPLFGVHNKLAGWLALVLGIAPVLIIKFLNLPTMWNLDVGVLGLSTGLIGLLMGKLLSAARD